MFFKIENKLTEERLLFRLHLGLDEDQRGRNFRADTFNTRPAQHKMSNQLQNKKTKDKLSNSQIICESDFRTAQQVFTIEFF